MLFFAQLINGLQLGAIYALVALGYNMVYGIVKLLNFAHGDVIMVGAYIALFSLMTGHHPVVASLITVGGCTLLAIIIEKTAYAPLRLAPRLSLLITAIGVSILLQNVAQVLFGARGMPFPDYRLLPMGSIQIGEANLAYTSILTIGISVATMAILTFIVQKTKLGRAIRAVSEDMGAAQLMGVNVNVVITFTFAVGAALAGVAALMYGVRFPQVTPMIGAMLGLRAFVAAVFGGIGSIPGAMIGGFVIGLLEVLVIAMDLSGWVDGAVFMLLIIVLLVRPTGLMGRNLMEKV